MSKERCQSVFNRLNSRCILAEGHDGRHAFPNALLKKENPTLWDRFQIAKWPYTADYLLRMDLASRGQLDYSEPKPEVTTDPQPAPPLEPTDEPEDTTETKSKGKKKKGKKRQNKKSAKE